MRKPVLWSIVGATVLALLVVGVVLVVRYFSGPSSPLQAECTVPAVSGPAVTVVVEGPQTSGAGAAGTAAQNASPAASTSVTVAPDVPLSAVALQNASTINAVGMSRGLTERARIIAVATAWQESGLRNLPDGDRDSVGLFQQRPSQGWGTATQIADPIYASGKFYDTLLAVSGWQSMSLTMAAQSVQYSAFPDAYAKWEPQATTLVRALSGADPVQLTCRAGAQPPTAAVPPRATVRTSGGTPSEALAGLLSSAQAELKSLSTVQVSDDGRTATVVVTGGPTTASVAARALAAWTVAHATSAGVTAVTVQGRQWADHAWTAAAGGSESAGTVLMTVG